MLLDYPTDHLILMILCYLKYNLLILLEFLILDSKDHTLITCAAFRGRPLVGISERSVKTVHTHTHTHIYIYIYFFFFFFVFFRALRAACGGSQARGQIRAVAAGLYYSHSNTRFRAVSASYTRTHGNADSLTH